MDISSIWDSCITDFGQWEAAADRALTTRQLRRWQLARLARAFPDGPSSVTADGLMAWLTSSQWSTETKRSHRGSVRTFFRWATLTGIVDHDPAAELPPIKPGHHLPRPVADNQWRTVVDEVDDRTRLIIELGARLGLRRAEIAAVHSDDLDRDLTGWSLRVRGKGRRVRSLQCPDDMAVRIQRAEGWVFASPLGGHLTPAHIGVLIRRATEGEWTCHQLRHRFGTTVYGATGDLLATQRLMGHQKPETTAGYVALGDQRLRAAALAAA